MRASFYRGAEVGLLFLCCLHSPLLGHEAQNLTEQFGINQGRMSRLLSRFVARKRLQNLIGSQRPADFSWPAAEGLEAGLFPNKSMFRNNQTIEL